MVKCQGLNEDGGPCGFDLQNAKFCPECGTKVPNIDVAKRKDTVACPGTDEGGPCSNKELPRGQKFCQICAWRVNQSIFEPGSRVCGANSGETRCTGIIRKNETVCPICKSDKGVPQTAVQKDQVNLAKPENQTQPEHGNGQCELSISEPESAQNPSTTATAHGKPASPFHQAETDQDDAASPPKIPRHTEDGCTEMDTAVDEPSTRSRVENETLQGHTEDGCTEVDTAVDEPSIRSRVENETLQGHGMPQHNTDQKSQTSGANLKLLYGAESQTAVDKNIIQGDNSGSVDTEQSTARSHTQPSGSNVQILYGSDNEEASQGTQNPTKNDCYILPQMSNDNVLQNSGSTSEDQSEKSKDNNHGDTWKPTFSLSTTTKKRSEETPTGKASLSDIAEKSDLSSEDSTPKGDDSTEKFPSSSAAITERGDMPVPKPMSEQKGRSDNSSNPPRQSVECTQGVDSSKITESQQQKGIFNFTGGSTQTTGNNTWQNPDRRFGDKSGSIKDDELFGDSNPSGSEEAEKLESSATGEPSTNPSSLFSLSQNSDKEVNTSSAQTDMDVDVQQQNQDATSLVSKSDGDSESSTDEEDQDDDSSLSKEGSQKKNAREKIISKTKSRREKKKERKKRKKEEKMKEKGITTDSEPTLPKKDKNQNNRSVRSSGKSTGAIGSSVDMDKSQGEATSMDASSENQWSNKRTRTDTVKVIFHTVFSPSILNDANGGAYLCMISLKVPHIKMKKGRSLDEGFEEYTAEFDLPKKHLDEYINYTYCVNASEGNQDYTPELFYDTTSRHGNVGRYLKVPRAALTSGTSTYTHHQYDGIVYGKLESPFYKKMWNKVFGINDHINNMVVDADRLLKFHFDQLITNLQTSDLTPEEFITMFQNMMRGLTYVYSYRGRIWYNPADFDLFVGKSFKDFALAFIERSQNSNIPEHLRLGIIITLVHIIMWLCPFNEKESKDMGTVCYHLQLQPSDKNTLTKVLDDLKSLFPTSLRMVTNTLQLMNNCLCGQTNNASWLLAAPLLHFLSGKSSPYQQPSTDTGHNKKDPVWWGVEDYKGAPEWFITKSNWNVSVNVMLRKLGPLFNADYLLPRTLMAIIKLNGDLLEAVKSRQFSPDVCIAKLFYCIKATRHMSGTEEKILQDSLEDISLQIMDEASRKKSIDTFSVEDKHQMQIDLYRLFVIGNDLLRVALEYYSVKEVFRVCSCKVTLQALALFEETHEELKEKNTRSVSKKFEHNYMETFDAIRRQVVQCLGNKYSSMHTHHAFKMNLEVWDRVLRIELPSKSLESAFIGFVKDALIKLLEKKMYDIILDVYCEHHNLYGSVVQDILSTLAFKALEKGTVIKTYGHSQYDTKTRYAKLLSSVFEKYWKKMTEEQMFQEAIKWTPFAHFVDMFYQAEHGEHLSEESGVQLTKATTAVEERMNQLKSGTILVKDHSVICANFEQFEKLIMLMMKKDKREMEPTYLRQLVDLRSKELQAFSEVYGLVTDLINMCSRFEVDIEALERKHRSLQNILDVPMSHLCTPGKLDNIMRPEDYRPVVAAFNLSPEELDLLPQMKHCSTSLVFINKWDSTGHRMKRQEGKLSVTKTFELVWEPCIAWWNTIKGKIKQGTMTFQEFDKIFGKHDCQIIEREFNLMEENGTWIKERMEQIQLFRDLENCVEGAKIILKVVAAYGLNGDFKPIELITSVMKGTDIAMNALDQSLRQICSVLGGVQEKHITCLREFINCEPLILWIKESMPSGLKELKVFVDLATISAGEGDIEIAKVRCLHSATTGYAPLIFNLNDDIGYKDFLEKCKLVWNELEADPNLHKKLHDTNRQIEWLKTVKKAHGSVEVTSLAQTEAINSVGIYQVGRLQDQKCDQKPELKDVISLHVSEDDNGARQRKVYHYDMLHDLQSRLMLVAGKAEKGKDDVDRFTLILDSVVRLANTYIKLVSSGCVLFSEWKARFLCDRDRRACSFITFGMGDHVSSLKGRKASEEDDVSSIVPRIAKFLEKCYEDWLQYIADKRDQYYELNYLTIDQMVILQKELVKVGTQQEPSQLIFPLLSAMKKDCSMADLISAMRTAQREVENMDELRDEEMAETGSEEEMEEGEEEAIFIREVMKTGYSEELARKALRHYKTDEIDEAVVWCMDHEDDIDEMDVEPDTSEERTEPQVEEFKGWTDTPSSISTVTSDLVKTLENINREVRVDPLVKDLEKLWEKFLTSISCSVSDYLSVEHLGLVLRCLAGKETFTIRRHLIQSFQEGVPNLIICPQNDIFNTVLTIYMNDRQQPLPQPDEVLICSSHTTLDQLDIFWRRAVFNQGNQIYCLANSDLLDYEVSDKGEQCLERHMQKAKDMGIQYKLVVLCSTENEYKSRIVAALERFRRPQLPVANQQMLQNYLADKLKVEKANMKISPASSVDFGRSSVRVVKSWRAGVGKSLYKTRRAADLKDAIGRRTTGAVVSIPLHEKEINVDMIMSRLLECTLPAGQLEPRIFHIDISYEVCIGVDAFLFQLLVLGSLSNSAGYVWIKAPCDHYLVEAMPLLTADSSKQRGGEQICFHRCFDILPDVICRSPEESLYILQGRKPPDYADTDLLFDRQEFESAVFQRPYQYLRRLDERRRLADIDAYKPEGDMINCLQTFLRHCGVRDPSWAELKHFVCFLNSQLQDFEVSAFCGVAAKEDLPGFDKFVLKFLIQMSRDFATRSLVMSEESPIQRMQRLALHEEEADGANDENIIQQFQMRRTWESSPHPYLFFNPDHHSMTFVGFKIERATGNLMDQQTGAVLEQNIMQRELQDSLIRNRVNIDENFDVLARPEKILKLCSVMGMDMPHDPDDTYELTTDNVKKILAIYMRFKCDIPVIIMGETGCGKTRLVKFMCALQCPPGVDLKNMILMKVHGGTKTKDIIKKVKEAEEIARKNADEYGQHIQTVLFFDEANTTEAIGLIKEIMCDRTIGGNQLKLCRSLKIIAACNPYRKHSEELIKRLEQAGLGYHVDAEKTTDKLGRVPLRRLVYRVQPLPQSLLPLVWDFGQLDTRVEELYIRQMVLRYIRAGKLPPVDNLENVVSKILTVSQDFMREQKDECSFVSLRDVERVLEVMSWFYNQSQTGSGLFHLLDEDDMDERSDDEEMSDDEQNEAQDINKVARSLLLALGVCYHACLKKREEYREAVVPHFIPPCQLPGPDPAQRMLEEIEHCQDVFLENVELGKNIAHNQALKENVFMMVTCIELRIPLFLVGKPGSSKSLAKTVVNNAMQGHAAHHELFRCYKEVQMMSYQCSPLSTPDGISGMFRQCAQFQEEKDLTRFVSVVVLDEVGLAEDSPRMPLKTLHPLLEDGCEGDEEPLPYKKVAFIGISNWALDPAKMNRGILVQREVPELEELTLSAKGICQTNRQVYRLIKPLIPQMADAYLHLFNSALRMREFFGLRDFYSLLKMVYAFADQQKRRPTWHQMQHAIMRNFGGMDDINPVEVFERVLTTINITETRKAYDPDCSPAGLIQACLSGDTKDSESRYLLLLTENYGALTILQQEILKKQRAITIFGSSFPSDQEYTQVCRNINRIKVCMETGNTVVLLNLENLYESLYDALNQYYVEFGGERYVDLGLGTHRVKCRVHKDFRLIVVAEKQIVYDKFPIPLINRLEKHFLNVSTMLTEEQLELTEKLKDWAKDFVNCQGTGYAQARIRKDEFTVGDVFMGYHADSCAAIVLHVYEQHYLDGGIVDHTQVFDSAMRMLLWCATPDAVMRLNSTVLTQDEGTLNKIYWEEQQHQCLSAYLHQKIRQENKDNHFAQVTTHSKLITSKDLEELSLTLGIPVGNMVLLNLQSFDTEQQFCRQIKVCFERGEEEMLLIVQSDCGDQNASLVACARYCIQDELQQLDYQVNRHAIFVIQLPRVAGGCFNGFQCGRWHSLHIDDLRPEGDMLGMSQMRGKSVGTLIHHAVEERTQRPTEISMETDSSVEDQDGQQNDMDVDEGDIHLDFNNVDRHSSNSTPSHKLPVENLVLNCILAALSMVKDAKMDAERSTVRVNQLMELLHFGKTDLVTNNLVKGICKHLDVLMTEKEQALLNPGNWLATEAARAEVINTAGTFRRAWTQCLETKVTPILTGIIAFMDTNRNLESLYRAKAGDWIQQLWLGIINCTKATGLQYSQLVSPGQTRQELPEVMVRHTGTDGHLFTAQMPFSWIYFRLIEDLLNTTKSSMSDQTDAIDVVNTVKNVLTSRPLGIMLQPLMDSDRQSVLKAYIHDFVHMMYQVSSPQEHQLVCESVYIGSRTIVQHQAADGLAMLIAVHLAYQEAVSRFRNFSSLNRVWPECSEAIIDFQESSPNFFLCSNEEMTLDVMGLHLLLETLEPVKDTLNKERNRAEWLQRVRHYRPAVERLLDMVRPGQDPDTIQCGPRCVKGIQDARMTWNCVLVMKLFLEHVYSIQAADDKFTINRCMPLWTMMKSGADMKSLGALQKVEKFLKMCNKLAVEHYSDIKKGEKCAHCENDMEEPPVYLPCKDKICRRCYNDTVIIKEMICPICHAEIPPNLKANEDIHKSEKSKKYFDYKKRINSFFMEVVSQLCFADDTPPSDEVVEKLLSYITRSTNKGTAVVTKKMTIFDDSIDPTPVLRSFLLQLLLRTSGDQVSIYLENYLQQAQRFVDQDQLIELCLLILQCLEDVYHQDISKSETSEKKEVRMATDMLKNNLQSIDNEELSVLKLYALAETRFALSVVAKYVQRIYVDKSIKMTRGYRQMIDAAARLCEECGSTWPCIYFIKLLCRRYGLDSYETVCKSGDANMCRWLQMLDLEREEVLECSDLYVVCGDNYIACREMVTRCKLGEDPASLIQQLEALRIMDWKKRVSLLLAVYREMTMSYVYPEDKRKTQPEMYEQLYEALSNHQLFQAQTNLLKAVFQNTIWRHVRCLDLRPGMELKDQSIICLLVHAGITFLQIPDDRSLLQPLITLALLPQNMANSFLPTMPQDDMMEIREALLAARDQAGNENPVIYRCPEGHPYLIGNCGRPATLGKCKDCGKDIGGTGYVLSRGNVQDDGTDQTKPGHILGRADQRTNVIVGERKMNPVSCAILRLLTHVSMLLGANENPQVIYNMIQPNIAIHTLADFLLNHIKLDIASLQRLTGRSVDDVLLLMHKVLDNLTETYKTGGAVTADVLALTTKAARNRWEEMFCKHCLSPLLQDMEKTMKSCNEQLTQDKRLGSDPLLCLLFEIDPPQEQTSATALQEVPTVWRFRSRISMDHLTTVFQTKMGREHQILRLFLDEDCHLRAIRLIPSILRLQRLLINKYQRKLDRAEATAFTVEQAQDDFIQDGKDDEVKLLIQDFAEAWNCVRQALENFPCPTSNGIAVVSKEFCSKQITDDSPIAMLLPTIKDAGLCSYVLVYFLLKKQKSFLEKYCKVKRQKMTDLPKVKVHDLSPAHLISYHPERDILPIVLANCNYSFEVGKGTKIEYDFGNIERQLGDRFLFAKSDIDIDEIEVMTYRSDVTNAIVFRSLREKIPQVQLGAAVRHQICQELRSLPEICDCLDKLDITISFLKSVGEDPTFHLDTFMTQTLKLTNPLVSPKSKAECQCQHVQCLWLTLAQEKTKCLAKHRKDVFDSLGDDYRKELTDQQRESLQYFCDGLQADKAEVLMEFLFECIMLMIAIPQNTDDEDAYDILNQSLQRNLEGYLYSPLYDDEPLLPDWLADTITRLDADTPDKLLVSQCVSVWLVLFDAYRQKERERR